MYKVSLHEKPIFGFQKIVQGTLSGFPKRALPSRFFI